MGEKEYTSIHNDYRNAVNSAGLKHYMFYGPTSSDYWEEDLKIVLFNMEPYGYQNSTFVNVNEDNTLAKWVFSKKNKNNINTNRNTVLFAYILKSVIKDGISITSNYIKKEFHNEVMIKQVLKEIVIYNIKPTSNKVVKEDYKGIIQSNQGDLGIFLKNEIYSLEPKIIVISGHSTLIAFKKLFGINKSFKNNGNVIIHNGVIIAAIKHFSRPSYKNWIGIIQKIKNLGNLTTAST